MRSSVMISRASARSPEGQPHRVGGPWPVRPRDAHRRSASMPYCDAAEAAVAVVTPLSSILATQSAARFRNRSSTSGRSMPGEETSR